MILYVISFCSTPEQEQLMVMWLSWMIKEEAYFERWEEASFVFSDSSNLILFVLEINSSSLLL